MISRVIDEDVKPIKYYPNYKECLKVWGLNRWKRSNTG